MVKIIEIMTNPIMQSFIANFIYSGVKKGGKRLFSDDLSQQFKTAIHYAFDKLSEKYPIRNFQGNYTFWDYVATKITDELNLTDFSEEKIKNTIKSVLEELLVDKSGKYDVDKMNNYFWYLFQCEIILHKELYKFLLFNYQKDMMEDIVLIKDTLESINNKKDSHLTEDELIDYLISLQQLYIREIGNNFIPRSFQNINEVKQSLYKIHEILDERSNNVLVLGEPGSGKTFAIKRMLYELTSEKTIKNSDKIPIFIDLAMFGHKFSSISDGIVLSLKKYINSVTKESVDNLLKKGKFILLLDGLDEVKQEFYEICIYELNELMQHMNKNKYILTCRENVYFGELKFLVETVRLTPLTKEQIEKNIIHHCDIQLTQLGKEHYELFGNPLFLNIGIEVIKNNSKEIPENRSVIFNKYIEYLLYKWDRKKGLRTEYKLSYYELVTFLSQIAYEKFEKPYLTTFELQEEINKQFPHESIHSIFGQVIKTGILIYNHNDEYLNFCHKTFKEYFAGREMINRIEKETDYEFLNNFVNNKEWYEVFIFAAGLFTNWNSQSTYLEYILDNNLKLYVDCVSSKNDFNEYLLSLTADEYSNLYLHTLVCTYEKMIERYFFQIKHQLNPYLGLNDDIDNLTICVLGQLSEDKKHLYFTFVAEEKGKKKVRFTSPREFHKYRKLRGVIIDNYVNLELSSLMGDSARKVALEQLKSQISKVFEEYRLNENSFLLCERVKEMSHALPIRNIDELTVIYKWLKDKIEFARNKVGDEGVFVGYKYNGVELTKLYEIVEILINEKIDYKKSLLPTHDLEFSKGGGVWSLYSKERLVERIGLFFEYYQKSFIYLVENNFEPLKEYLQDYIHLPYKYIVEIEFNDELEVKSHEPLMTYYYIATSSLEETKPTIKIVEKRSSWEEQEDIIKKSFDDKQRFTNAFSASSTGVTMTMFERSRGRKIPLLSNSYSLVKSNLERIFGRL